MRDWAQLGTDLAVKSRRAQEQAELAFHRRLAQQAYRRWAEDVVFDVIHRLHEELTLRSAEMTLRSAELGHSVGSTYRLNTPRSVPLEAGGAARCVLSLSVEDSNVDLYSQWTPGSPPAVHLLLSRQRGGRPAQLVCLPGAWLVRPERGSGFELRSFESDGRTLPLEDLAFRAARLLLVH